MSPLHDTPSLFADNIFEYAPDTGAATSWPHVEWDYLSSILCCRNDTLAVDQTGLLPIDGGANIESNMGISTATNGITLPAGRVANWWFLSGNRSDTLPIEESIRGDQVQIILSDIGTQSLPVSKENRGSNFDTLSNVAHSHEHSNVNNQKTTFHVAPLGKFLTMIVMVKDEIEEESMWSRRRGKCLDELEIKLFLHDMTDKLCLRTVLFSTNNLASIPSGEQCHSSYHQVLDRICPNDNQQKPTRSINLKLPFIPNNSPEIASLYWSDEEVIETFLDEIKEVVGLRRSTCRHFHDNTLHSSHSESIRSISSMTPLSMRRLSHHSRSQQHQQQQQYPPHHSCQTNDTTSSAFRDEMIQSFMSSTSASAWFLGPELASHVA
jgi:hypothetical protein